MALRRRYRLLIAVALAAAALALLGVLVLRSPWFEGWLGTQIVQVLEAETHERAELRRAKVTLWPIGVELMDLTLSHRPTGESIVTVRSARAGLAVRDYRIKLGRVTVVRPRVHLHLDEKGRLREFQNPTPSDSPPGPKLEELPWGGVHVIDAAVRVSFPEGEAALTDVSLIPIHGTITDIAGTLDLRWRDFRDRATLRWPRAQLGPDRIELPDLTVALRSLQVTGAARWALQGAIDTDLQLHSDLDELTPLLPGPRTIAGTLDAQVVLSGSQDAPEAALSLYTSKLDYTAPGKVWPVVRYRLDALHADVGATPQGIDIHHLFARHESSEVNATGRIEPVDRGLGARWEVVDSTVLGDAVSLATILRAAGVAPTPWVDFLGRAEVHVTGPLKPLQLDGDFRVDLADFEVRQGPVEEPSSPLSLGISTAALDGRITVYQDHLVLDAKQLQTRLNRGEALAAIYFGPQGPLDLQVDLSRADLSEMRPLGGSTLMGRGRLTGTLRGDFNDLRATGFGVFDGFAVGGVPYADHLEGTIRSDMKSLFLTDVQARTGQTPYTGRFSMDFTQSGMPMDTAVTLQTGRVEDLLGLFMDLGELVTGRVEGGELELIGPVNDLNGGATLDLADVHLLSERFERGHAAGRMHDGTFTLDDLSVRRGSTQGLTVRGSVGRAWALDMVAAGELRLETLDALEDAGLDLDLNGRVSGLFTIDNTLLDPAPHGQLRVFDASIGGQPLSDSELTATTTDGRLTAGGTLLGESVAINLSADLWDEQAYDVRAHLDRLPIDRLYPFGADGSPVQAQLSGDVAISGRGGERPSPVQIEGVFPSALLTWGRHALRSEPSRPWRLTADGDRWSLRDVTLSGGESTLSLTASGTAESTLIDGAGQLDADLMRMGVPGLERAEGIIDLAFTSRGEQSTRVDVSLDAPLLQHESVPTSFEDLHARAVLTPNRFTLTHFAAQLGGGTVQGDAQRQSRLFANLRALDGEPFGVIQAKDWLPTRYDLYARASNVQMQWVDDLPPAVGDATLAFDGPADALLLHADINVTDMAFTDRIEWEDWVVALEEYLLVEAPPTDEPPWFGLDIHIRADRTIRLLNNVSDATASADLQLLGDTSRMGMTGRVRVEDGQIFLQDRAFDVMRGELRFDDPYSWDPLVDFDLRTDIQSRARQYRINYRISGPYSAWSSRTLSNPRLPQADINALLWFGVTADELEDMGELTSAVGMAAADFMFKDFVQNDYLGLGLSDTAIFDRLPRIELSTGVNLRGEYSSEPRALIRQRWSPTLSTLAEINLVRDDHFARLDWRTDDNVLLSTWWASRRREGFAVPLSGALGVDLRWVLEFD